MKLDKAIAREVMKSRGEEKITVAALRKKFPALRGLSMIFIRRSCLGFGSANPPEKEL